jgi:hypothetical protein
VIHSLKEDSMSEDVDRRTLVNAAMLEATKMVGRRMEAREREGLPDLPPGHPMLAALAAQKQRDALGKERQKVRKAKKAEKKSQVQTEKEQDKEARMGEATKLIERLSTKVTSLDSELKEIYGMTVSGADLLADDVSMRVRFSRLARTIFAFHAALREACGPLTMLAERHARTKKED